MFSYLFVVKAMLESDCFRKVSGRIITRMVVILSLVSENVHV